MATVNARSNALRKTCKPMNTVDLNLISWIRDAYEEQSCYSMNISPMKIIHFTNDVLNTWEGVKGPSWTLFHGFKSAIVVEVLLARFIFRLVSGKSLCLKWLLIVGVYEDPNSVVHFVELIDKDSVQETLVGKQCYFI